MAVKNVKAQSMTIEQLISAAMDSLVLERREWERKLETAKRENERLQKAFNGSENVVSHSAYREIEAALAEEKAKLEAMERENADCYQKAIENDRLMRERCYRAEAELAEERRKRTEAEENLLFDNATRALAWTWNEKFRAMRKVAIAQLDLFEFGGSEEKAGAYIDGEAAAILHEKKDSPE